MSTGKPIRAWDSRGHNFRTEYDALRRPAGHFVLGTDRQLRPATTAQKFSSRKYIWRGPACRAQPRARVFRMQTGRASSNQGPIPQINRKASISKATLRGSREFFADYKALPDLTAPPPTPEPFRAAPGSTL